MKKSALQGLARGSAAYVVAHGKYQRSRGRGYSMSFGPITNPEKAYRMADHVLKCCLEYVTPKRLEYIGDFILELTSEGGIDLAREVGARVFGQEIHASGSVSQSMGGIQLYNGNQPFFYGYSFLMAIRKASGEYLWKNTGYERMK